MKIQYDKVYAIPTDFKEQAYIRLSKKNDKGYHLANKTKLSFIKAGPLKIICLYRKLAYELELPHWLPGINPVISVKHLEPAPSDPYLRQLPRPSPIHVNTEAQYIINKIEDVKTCKEPSYPKQPWYCIR